MDKRKLLYIIGVSLGLIVVAANVTQAMQPAATPASLADILHLRQALAGLSEVPATCRYTLDVTWNAVSGPEQGQTHITGIRSGGLEYLHGDLLGKYTEKLFASGDTFVRHSSDEAWVPERDDYGKLAYQLIVIGQALHSGVGWRKPHALLDESRATLTLEFEVDPERLAGEVDSEVPHGPLPIVGVGRVRIDLKTHQVIELSGSADLALNHQIVQVSQATPLPDLIGFQQFTPHVVQFSWRLQDIDAPGLVMPTFALPSPAPTETPAPAETPSP